MLEHLATPTNTTIHTKKFMHIRQEQPSLTRKRGVIMSISGSTQQQQQQQSSTRKLASSITSTMLHKPAARLLANLKQKKRGFFMLLETRFVNCRWYNFGVGVIFSID